MLLKAKSIVALALLLVTASPRYALPEDKCSDLLSKNQISHISWSAFGNTIKYYLSHDLNTINKQIKDGRIEETIDVDLLRFFFAAERTESWPGKQLRLYRSSINRGKTISVHHSDYNKFTAKTMTFDQVVAWRDCLKARGWAADIYGDINAEFTVSLKWGGDTTKTPTLKEYSLVGAQYAGKFVLAKGLSFESNNELTFTRLDSSVHGSIELRFENADLISIQLAPKPKSEPMEKIIIDAKR